MQITWNSFTTCVSLQQSQPCFPHADAVLCPTIPLLQYFLHFPKVQYCFVSWFLYCVLAFINYSASHPVLWELLTFWSPSMPEVQSSAWRFHSTSFILPNCLLPSHLFHKLISISSVWNIFPAHICIIQLTSPLPNCLLFYNTVLSFNPKMPDCY